MTRNEDTYLRGQMELADNVAYGNGINGVVFHRTNRGVVQRNTCHDNGVVPRLEHPGPIVEDWHIDLRKSRKPYSGIVINNAEGVELWSNNVAARYDDDYAFNIVADGALPPLAAGGNNQVCKGLVNVNLESVVSEATDPAVCGLPPVTSAPSKNPTRSPSTSPSRAPSTFPTVSVRVASIPLCSGLSILVLLTHLSLFSFITADWNSFIAADGISLVTANWFSLEGTHYGGKGGLVVFLCHQLCHFGV